MRSLVRVPAGVDLKGVQTMFIVQWGRPDSEEVIKQAWSTTLGALQPWTRPDLMESKLQAMTTKSNASCQCSGYNTLNRNMVYKKEKRKKDCHKKVREYIQYSILMWRFILLLLYACWNVVYFVWRKKYNFSWVSKFSTLLEKFWRISLYVNDGAVAKLYNIWRKV